MTTCVKLLIPLEENKAKTLLKVVATADKHAVPILLCGATARDILFWHMHKITLDRGTLDLDISIQLSDWPAYNHFQQLVLDEGFESPNENHPEKLRDKETGVDLDLLPFGEIADDKKTIVWPEDNSPWSVIGYEEALANALYLRVGNDDQNLKIAFSSAPTVVMLKMIAVHDRPDERFKKDGTDIGFIIEHYLDIGNGNRLTKHPHDDIMTSVDNDLDLATATLLGRDIRKIANENTRQYLLHILTTETTSNSRCHLARGLKEDYYNGSFPKARTVLAHIAKGLRS